ncbi:MAG: oxidoreductase, partial [Cypionkella sp.]
ETHTVWTEGLSQFSGPSLATLLDRVGAGDGNLQLSALNDYSVEVLRSMIGETAPIIANRMNGKEFSRRDKGPLWVVFPYDSSDDFRTENTYIASVWQLSRITVLRA